LRKEGKSSVIYEMRQASGAWNERLEGELSRRGFVQSNGKDGAVLSLFFVDDGLVAARSCNEADALVN
jgi:hypothetical protein